MELKHYLEYFQNSVKTKWSNLAFKDLDGTTSYTYGEMASEIARMHTTFRLMGVEPGDRIALCGRNCSNWGLLFMAIQTYKAVAVSILPDFTAEGVHGLVNHSGSKILFVGPNVLKRVDPKEMPTLNGMFYMDDLSLQYAPTKELEAAYATVDAEFKKEWPNGLRAEDVKYPTDTLDDLALINYTSGSTGNPKGVMLTNRNLSGNIEFALKALPHQPNDKMVSILPIAHMFGLMFEFMYQTCDGCELYFLTKAPTPTALMKAFAEIRPFMILTVPLVIEKIIRKSVLPTINKPVMKVLWKTPGIKSVLRKKVNEKLIAAFGGNVRHLIIGGAALNEEVEKCLHDIKFRYCVGYGMTECAPLISYEAWDKYAFRSCGKACLGMQIRIDSEDPQNKEGEVQVYGTNVMTGYYKNEQATKETFTKDGWMRTGDLGILDKDGNLFLRGRSKNMLLGPSGQNIYPEEIEDKLNSLPLVLESVVVQRDQKLVALIFPDNTPEGKQILNGGNMLEFMEANRVAVNKVLPQYSQISAIELVEKEFEKTPKRSIKRFLYS